MLSIKEIVELVQQYPSSIIDKKGDYHTSLISVDDIAIIVLEKENSIKNITIIDFCNDREYYDEFIGDYNRMYDKNSGVNIYRHLVYLFDGDVNSNVINSIHIGKYDFDKESFV